jgi:hypothetical protein
MTVVGQPLSELLPLRMNKMPKIVIVKETFDGWYQSPIIETSSRRPVDGINEKGFQHRPKMYVLLAMGSKYLQSVGDRVLQRVCGIMTESLKA